MSDNENDFLDKMKGWLDKGLDASKDFLTKAGDKVQDWGEKGCRKVDAMQIERQISRKMTELGMRTYKILSSSDAALVDRTDSEVETLLNEIEKLKVDLESKQNSSEDSSKLETTNDDSIN